jgi:Fe-S cluster assembly protein SufD
VDEVVLTHADGTAIPLTMEGNELCLSIDPYVRFDAPLFLTYRRRGTGPALRLTLRTNASVHLIENVEETLESSSSLSVEVGEEASFQYTRLFLRDTTTLSSTSLRALVHTGGSLICRTATALPSFRSDSSVILQGEGASAAFYGLSLLPLDRSSHQTLFVDHLSPNTSSSQLVKGLASDGAHGLIESHVRIRKEARGSTSRQYSHFLTLGTAAKTVHKPNFEIFTDDVIASHGATTGMLDDEALFYLRARGLGVQEARRRLIEGFCEEIIRELPPDVAPKLYQRMDEMIGAEQ